MAWKDNAVGVTIDRTMNPDFAALKAKGFQYVVIDCGTGTDASPAFGEQFDKATAAGLPVIAQFQPVASIDDYTFEAPTQEQIPVLKKILGNRAIRGLVISMEHWWIGYDVEEGRPGRPATNPALSYAGQEFMNTFKKQYELPGVKVMLRTNDGFVQKYSPDMASWSDLFPFFLADWRYRVRDDQGAYTIYKYFSAQVVNVVAEIFFPPDGSKNPLIPGYAPQLKFWEFNGQVDIGIKGWDGKPKRVKVSAFNGPWEDLKKFLKIEETNPGTPNPTPSDTGRITVLLEQIAADIAYIAGFFRRIGGEK